MFLLLSSISFFNVSVFQFGTNGTVDFAQYWSAFNVLINGGNPYSFQSIAEVQRSIGNSGLVIMMWSPPWLLVLLSPILAFDFQVAAGAWFLLNVVMWILSVILLSSMFSNNARERRYITIAGVFFYPIVENLLWGQISVFVLFFLVLFMFLLYRDKDFLAGILLIPCTVKPHLFILFAVVLLWWMFRNRRFNMLYGALLGSVVLLIVTHIINNQVVANWYQAILSGPNDPLTPSVFQWKSATLSALIRSNLPAAETNAFVWIYWIIPLLATIICLGYLLRSKIEIELRNLIPPVLCLSFLVAPYGWFYDQSILVITQCSAVAIAFKHARYRSVLLLLTAVQIVTFLLSSRSESAQSDFFWLPIALLAIWLLSYKTRNFSEKIIEDTLSSSR